jgi:hypothetical protein
VPTLAAQLSGSNLVVAVAGELRVYDAQTGVLRAEWPLPGDSAGHDCDPYGDPSCTRTALTLDDVARGLAAYVYEGYVHLLRLVDGATAIVGAGAIARFTDSALMYADGARIRRLPFARLPLSHVLLAAVAKALMRHLLVFTFITPVVTVAAISGGRAVSGVSPPATQLSSSAADVDASSPQVALDARGDAFAIWRETRPGGDVIEAATRLAGQKWSPAHALVAGEDARLAVDPGGDAVVAGITPGERTGVFVVYRRAGGSWGQARLLVRSGGTTCCGWGSVAIDSSGRALVAFGHGTAIEVASRGRDQHVWRTRKLGHGLAPVGAVDARGDTLVAWHAANAFAAPILTTWRLRGRPWQHAQLLPQPRGEHPWLPVIEAALDARGAATVLTASVIGEGPSTLAIDVSNARRGGRFALPQQVGTAVEEVGTRLGVAADGRAAVVYVPGHIDGPLFATTRAAVGRSFAAPVELAQQSAFSPALAIGPGGQALVIWAQSSGYPSQLTLEAAEGSPDGSFGRPLTLAQIGGDCFAHRCFVGWRGTVALDAAGRGVVAWVTKADPTARTGGVVHARDVDLGALTRGRSRGTGPRDRPISSRCDAENLNREDAVRGHVGSTACTPADGNTVFDERSAVDGDQLGVICIG